MAKFKYDEKVIIKATGKEVFIASVTESYSKKSTYILSNGKQVTDIDLLKLSEKKTTVKKASVSVVRKPKKTTDNKIVAKK